LQKATPLVWFGKMSPEFVGSSLNREIPAADLPNAEETLDELAPRSSIDPYRWLRPALVDAGGPPPSLLMSWWALLFGLSMLARYEPATWAEMLNVDGQEWAVPIEFVLAAAARTIPVLVAQSLYA
jgi:hypothetical protein